MSKYKNRHRIWLKTIAMVVVCLFTINTISWAYPGDSISAPKTTLQVQSIFKPILDSLGLEYSMQFEYEIQTIIRMTLRGEEFQDINAALDTGYAAGRDKKKRLLKLTGRPEKNDNGIVLELELINGPKNNKRITIDSSLIESLLSAEKKSIQIGKLAKALVDEMEFDDSGVSVPVQNLRIGKRDERKIHLTETDTNLIEEVKRVVQAWHFTDSTHRQILLHILEIFEDLEPIFATYDELIEDLMGFISEDNHLIAIHRLLLKRPIALFHEMGEYLAQKEQINFEFAASWATRFFKRIGLYGLFKRFGLFHGKIIIKNKTGSEIGEIALNGPALSIALKDPNSSHYILRAIQRQMFGPRDRFLTEQIKTYATKKPIKIPGMIQRFLNADDHKSLQQIALGAQDIELRRSATRALISMMQTKNDDPDGADRKARYALKNIAKKDPSLNKLIIEILIDILKVPDRGSAYYDYAFLLEDVIQVNDRFVQETLKIFENTLNEKWREPIEHKNAFTVLSIILPDDPEKIKKSTVISMASVLSVEGLGDKFYDSVVEKLLQCAGFKKSGISEISHKTPYERNNLTETIASLFQKTLEKEELDPHSYKAVINGLHELAARDADLFDVSIIPPLCKLAAKEDTQYAALSLLKRLLRQRNEFAEKIMKSFENNLAIDQLDPEASPEVLEFILSILDSHPDIYTNKTIEMLAAFLTEVKYDTENHPIIIGDSHEIIMERLMAIVEKKPQLTQKIIEVFKDIILERKLGNASKFYRDIYSFFENIAVEKPEFTEDVIAIAEEALKSTGLEVSEPANTLNDPERILAVPEYTYALDILKRILKERPQLIGSIAKALERLWGLKNMRPKACEEIDHMLADIYKQSPELVGPSRAKEMGDILKKEESGSTRYKRALVLLCAAALTKFKYSKEALKVLTELIKKEKKDSDTFKELVKAIKIILDKLNALAEENWEHFDLSTIELIVGILKAEDLGRWHSGRNPYHDGINILETIALKNSDLTEAIIGHLFDALKKKREDGYIPELISKSLQNIASQKPEHAERITSAFKDILLTKGLGYKSDRQAYYDPVYEPYASAEKYLTGVALSQPEKLEEIISFYKKVIDTEELDSHSYRYAVTGLGEIACGSKLSKEILQYLKNTLIKVKKEGIAEGINAVLYDIFPQLPELFEEAFKMLLILIDRDYFNKNSYGRDKYYRAEYSIEKDLEINERLLKKLLELIDKDDLDWASRKTLEKFTRKLIDHLRYIFEYGHGPNIAKKELILLVSRVFKLKNIRKDSYDNLYEIGARFLVVISQKCPEHIPLATSICTDILKEKGLDESAYYNATSPLVAISHNSPDHFKQIVNEFLNIIRSEETEQPPLESAARALGKMCGEDKTQAKFIIDLLEDIYKKTESSERPLKQKAALCLSMFMESHSDLLSLPTLEILSEAVKLKALLGYSVSKELIANIVKILEEKKYKRVSLSTVEIVENALKICTGEDNVKLLVSQLELIIKENPSLRSSGNAAVRIYLAEGSVRNFFEKVLGSLKEALTPQELNEYWQDIADLATMDPGLDPDLKETDRSMRLELFYKTIFITYLAELRQVLPPEQFRAYRPSIIRLAKEKETGVWFVKDGLGATKHLIASEDDFTNICNDLFDLRRSIGENDASSFFQHALPALKHLIQTRDDLNSVGEKVIEASNAVPEARIFHKAIPATAKLIKTKDDLENICSDIVKISKKAGENSDILSGVLMQVEYLISTREDLTRIGNILVKLLSRCKRNGMHETFHAGLEATKHLIHSENDLEIIGEILVDINHADDNSYYIFREGLRAVKPILRSAEDVKKCGQDMLHIIKNFPEHELQEMFNEIERLRDLIKKHPNIWKLVIRPAIYSQGPGIYWCINEIRSLENYIQCEDDMKFLGEFITQHGTRAIDLLGSFLYSGIRKEIISLPFSQEKDMINAFFKEVPYPIIDIYEAYKKDPERLKELRAKCQLIHKKIVEGDATEYEDDPLFVPMLMHVFPLSVTLRRSEYENVYRTMSDRPKDTKKIPSSLQNKHVEINMGQYALKDPGNPLDTSPWQIMSNAIRIVNEEEKVEISDENIIKIGEKLLVNWQKGTLYNNREELITELYKYFRHSRKQRLSPSLGDIKDIMRLKEFMGDTMRDMIQECINHYKEEHPGEYKKLRAKMIKTQTANPRKVAKTVMSVLGRYGYNNESKEKIAIILRIKDELTFEAVWEEMKDAKSEEDITDILKEVSLGPQEGKESILISHQLQGGDYKAMQSEITNKYEFHESEEKVKLRFLVSKRKAHSVAGLNMGVCTAANQELWQNPSFMYMIIFDENDIAQGGIHFLIIEEDGGKYLALPGINPSVDLLTKVSLEDIYDKFIAYAEEVAKALGRDGVIIPEDMNIHSNRTEIQRIIAAKKYSSIYLEEVYKFTGYPYNHRFQKCFFAAGKQIPKDPERKKRSLERKIKHSNTWSLDILKMLSDYSEETKDTTPINVVIDRSLISDNDKDMNIETIAQLILLCRKAKNINFTFKLPFEPAPFFSTGKIDEEIEKAASEADILTILKKKLTEKAQILDPDLDVNEFFKVHINAEEREGEIQIPILTKEWLVRLRDSSYVGQELKEHQYPVAFDGVSANEKGIALRNFEAALIIGLAQASMAIASRRDAEKGEGEEKELPELRKKLLKKLSRLYKVFFKDRVELTEETLDNMISPYPGVRQNLAITLALPPVTRMALEKLREFHKTMQLALMAA